MDAANGPGTDFLDLPPAVAAAADGDTLEVRAGAYASFATNKGLAIFGVPGQTRVSSHTFGAITVDGLPAQRTFTMWGITLTTIFTAPILVRFSNNRGHVHVEGLESGATSSSAFVRIANSDSVTLSRCGLQSLVVVAVDASNANIANSHLAGHHAFSDPRVGSQSAAAGLEIRGGVVELADCDLIGGNGALAWPYLGQYLPSAPGVSMAGGTLRMRAGARASIRAGTGVNPATPMPAIYGTGSAEIDTRVTLTSYANAPVVDPNVQATFGNFPGLSLSSASAGGSLTLTHLGAANQPCVFATGRVVARVPLPFGDLYLDPTALVTLPALLADGTGLVTLTLPVPNDPFLVGKVIPWQAGSAVGTALRLSNAASVQLR